MNIKYTYTYKEGMHKLHTWRLALAEHSAIRKGQADNEIYNTITAPLQDIRAAQTTH